VAVRIVTDSTNYLPAAEITRLGIAVVPLHVHDGDELRPETEVDIDAFYRRLEDMRTLPTSSQPSPEEIAVAFRAVLNDGDEVLGAFLSSRMSGTVQSAELAAGLVCVERPGASIKVLDTESNCMQEGYAVLSAAEAAAAGASLTECIAAARESMARTRFLFCPKSLEYLRRGGRISGAAKLLGSMLQLTPVLTVDGGVTEVAAKVRTRHRALAEMGSRFRADVDACGLRRAVVHSIADLEAAEQFADEYVAPLVGGDVEVLPIGPVIGLHVGPAVGVVYETEKPLR
jgi:DegV family protein with EDD domain